MLSVEVGAGFSHNPSKRSRLFLEEWKQAIKFYLPKELQPSYLARAWSRLRNSKT
ncbi:hypothetical protein U9R62_09005 [Cylindrospermopsis raciborskii DSH]